MQFTGNNKKQSTGLRRDDNQSYARSTFRRSVTRIDTADLLARLDLTGEATRSVQLGVSVGQASEYRSIAVPKRTQQLDMGFSSTIQSRSFGAPMQAPVKQAQFDMSGLTMPSKPKARSTQPLYTGLQMPGLSQPTYEAPAVPSYSMTKNVLDLDNIKTYPELCDHLHKYRDAVRMNDFQIDQEGGSASGRWWSDKHMEDVSFSIDIYKKLNGGYQLAIQRQSGSAFAFHDVLMECRKYILGQSVHERGKVVQGLLWDGEKELDGGDCTISLNSQNLEGFTRTLTTGCLEAVRSILPILSKASVDAQNSKNMAEQGSLFQQLLRWACGDDSKSARYALTTLYNILSLVRPTVEQQSFEQLCAVATNQNAGSQEVVMRSLKTLEVLMKTQSDHLDTTKISQELQNLRTQNPMIAHQVNLLLAVGSS